MAKNAPDFPPVFTLNALQDHTQAVCDHFGWSKLSNHAVFMMLTEEVGEVAKAMRKLEGLAGEKNKDPGTIEARRNNLGEELADVLSYVLDLANRYEIDLEEYYTEKMQETLQREWNPIE
jgi:NTP pyrophosphatase (non-canonical NTP hydrolase)